jgi:hypothetical protein
LGDLADRVRALGIEVDPERLNNPGDGDDEVPLVPGRTIRSSIASPTRLTTAVRRHRSGWRSAKWSTSADERAMFVRVDDWKVDGVFSSRRSLSSSRSATVPTPRGWLKPQHLV